MYDVNKGHCLKCIVLASIVTIVGSMGEESARKREGLRQMDTRARKLNGDGRLCTIPSLPQGSDNSQHKLF